MAQYEVKINDKVRAIVEADNYTMRDADMGDRITVRVVELIVAFEDMDWICG